MNNKLYLKQRATFPEFSEMSAERLQKASQNMQVEFLPVDGVMEILFAPDPVTGVPRSDLAMLMAKDSRPEVSQYIRENLMKELPSTNRTDDPDRAIEFTKSRHESLQEYGERLRALCQKIADESKPDES